MCVGDWLLVSTVFLEGCDVSTHRGVHAARVDFGSHAKFKVFSFFIRRSAWPRHKDDTHNSRNVVNGLKDLHGPGARTTRMI